MMIILIQKYIVLSWDVHSSSQFGVIAVSQMMLCCHFVLSSKLSGLLCVLSMQIETLLIMRIKYIYITPKLCMALYKLYLLLF